MSKFNKADRQILFQLDRNSRAPYSQIGKQIGMSQFTVGYRVRRLTERGVISKFNTVINTGRLGYSQYKFYLKLHSIDEMNKQEIVDYLCAMPQVTWVAELDGIYDITFTVGVKKITDLSSAFDSLMGRYTHCIAKRSFGVDMKLDYFSREYLLGDVKRRVKPRSSLAEGSYYELDSINKIILKELCLNSRLSAVELQKRLELADDVYDVIGREAVLQRIRKLEKEKIIIGYNTVLYQTAIGQIFYKNLIYLNEHSPETIEKFIADCTRELRVTRVVRTLGEWDLELNFEVESPSQCRERMARLTAKYPGLIRDSVRLTLTHIRKFNVMSPV